MMEEKKEEIVLSEAKPEAKQEALNQSRNTIENGTRRNSIHDIM